MQVRPHIAKLCAERSFVRKGYLTKEQTDKAVLITGGILAGGTLAILAGLVFKAKKTNAAVPSVVTPDCL